MSLSQELGLQKQVKKQIKEDWSDPEYCLTTVRQNGWALEYVKNQTPELCLAAVKRDGYALQHVEDQTPELCLEAVKQDGGALFYVKNQTPELCLAAVKQNGHTLEYVEDQTPEIIQAAVSQNPHAVNHIDTNILPISDWDVEWFKYIWSVELKRKFIKERGKEIFKELNPKIIQENDEYCLIEYKLDDVDNISKALLFRCPSSNDLYFQEIDPKIKTLKSALKFLNNNISKEELAYES